jgi:hypothetical protein
LGYNDRDEGSAPAPATSVSHITTASRFLGLLSDAVSLAVRIIGVGLLLAGLWITIEVVQEAWGLYRDPGLIEPLAQAMEKGTGLDALLRSAAGDGAAGAPAPRISYLLALFFAPVLLFTAGYLAMMAVRTGGYLALGRPSDKS